MSKDHDNKQVNKELLEQVFFIINNGVADKVQIDNGEHFTWITLSIRREKK